MSKSGITRKAQLGLRELIAIGVGGMIGGGIQISSPKQQIVMAASVALTEDGWEPMQAGSLVALKDGD